MLKKTIRLSLQFVLLITMTGCLLFHNLLLYALAQAKGQLTIMYNAQPIHEIINQHSLPDSLEKKLLLIEEIKKFATDSLGIKASNNYSSVYLQSQQPTLVTITACEPFSLKPKEWYFPVLGKVPYIGFFNLEKAKKEINKLKYRGYDVNAYSPSGWSTLGWFNDPILSNMLYQSEGQLANLIIHELTHGTIFIKNDVTFNENLASFIGDKGAERFLIYKYGIASKQYLEYQHKKHDEKLYTQYILKSTKRLDSLYRSMNEQTPTEIKTQKKKELIAKIVMGVKTLQLYKKQNYFKFSLQAFKEKNAFFMGFQRYDAQYDFFEKEYHERFYSNLKAYVNSFKER